MHDVPRGPIVREVACKTVLNRSSLGDYSLNCYGGCTHACVYCYARFMERFHPHEEPWGQFVDVKTNAVEALLRQVRKMPPGAVFMSSACDGWQPVERQYELTRACCRVLIKHGFEVHALTKSALVLRDLDVLALGASRVGVTVTTLDERLRRLWEPGASNVQKRFEVLRQAKQAGLDTSVMFGPLLPFLSDTPESIQALLERAGDLGVDVIWFDGMNPRSKVWESVLDLLRREFPDLAERYRRVLFSPPVREAYLKGLSDRVRQIARRLHLNDRVQGC